MEYGINKRIKVIWITHFSSELVRKEIKFSTRLLDPFLRNILGKTQKNIQADFAPWVINLIKEFEQFDNVELHIISPHRGMQKKEQSFIINGISYHFFSPEGHNLFSKLFRKITGVSNFKYKKNRTIINRQVQEINPDIVNLIGAESPYYSIVGLDIKNIPLYLSCQTVYTNPLRKVYSDTFNQECWDLELLLHQKINYFGCDGRMYRDLVLKNNPTAIVFKMIFAKKHPKGIKQLPKKFDFVFFAAIVAKKKGIEDAIEALAIIKKGKKDVSLNVVGLCPAEYKAFLKFKIQKLNLQDNITFNEYFPVHSDMHQHITQGRCAILPIKLDVIPGAVIEAMLLEIPVVTYKTTGTPYLNKDGETILISDIDDIETLAANMQNTLDMPDRMVEMSRKAKEFVEREFDNTRSAKRLLNNYFSVIEHYRNNTPIPEGQLFDTTEFPIYS